MDRVVVQTTQDVRVMVVHHHSETTAHQVVVRVPIDVNNMTVQQVVTPTKVQLESMVVLPKDIETHQG